MAESRQRREDTPQQTGDTSVFGQLDGLKRDEAERVLERAIRLSNEGSPSGDARLSVDDISRVAAELGIGADTVQKALREEMQGRTAQTHGIADALLGPKQVRGQISVSGSSQEVAETVAGWMVTEEGLRPVSRSGQSIVWEKDAHWATSMRLAMGSEATKALRGMKTVTHRQRTLSAEEQLVELDADTSVVRIGSAASGASFLVAGIGGGIGVAVGMAGGNDLVQFLYAALPSTALGVGLTWGVAKAWISSVEKGIDRALAGISQPDLYGRAKKRRRRRLGSRSETRNQGSMGRLTDEIKGMVDDILER